MRQPAQLLPTALLSIALVPSVLLPAASAQQADPLAQAHQAYANAYQALAQKDLPLAQREFQQVVRLAPQLPEGHNGLGYVLLQTGHPRQAAAEFEKAIRIAPTRPAEEALAQAAAQIPDTQLALSALSRAAALGPLSPEAALLDSHLLAAAGKPDQAIAALRSTLDAMPAVTPQSPAEQRRQAALLHDSLGAILAQQQQWSDAHRELQAALSLDDLLPSALLHMGSLLRVQLHPEQALPLLQQAAELEPADIPTLLELARDLTALHRDQDAVATLRKAEQLSSATTVSPQNRIAVLYQLGLALQNTNTPGDSIPYFQQVVQAQPQNEAALVDLGLALVQTGKPKEATPCYLRALQLQPNDATLRLGLGVDYLQRSDLDDAVEQFRAGLAIAPESAELHYDLGLAYKLKDNVEAAIPELKKALELQPTLVDPHITLGTLDMQLGTFDEAATEMQAVLAAQPDNGDIWATLGSVYKQAGKLPQAEDALHHAIALLPQQPGAHTTLASVLQEEGRTDEARAERNLAGTLTKAAMSQQAALFATNAGDLLLSKGQLDEAIAQYRTAIHDQPDYAPAHRQLAIALDKKGLKAEAEAERKLATASQ